MQVLAKINESQITDLDIDRMVGKYPPEKRGYFQTNHGRKQLLEQKIAYTLLGQYAKEMQIDHSEEYRREMEDVSHQLLTKLVMEQIFETVQANEKDALAVYNTNKEHFQQSAQAEAKHILVEEKALARQIKEQILNEEISFAQAAKQHSICPSKEKGGSLGTVEPGNMVPEFEQAMFATQPGMLSDPVKSQYGYHLIYVESYTPSRQLTFEEMKEEILGQLQAQQQQEIYEETLQNLRKKYGCEIYD